MAPTQVKMTPWSAMLKKGVPEEPLEQREPYSPQGPHCGQHWYQLVAHSVQGAAAQSRSRSVHGGARHRQAVWHVLDADARRTQHLSTHDSCVPQSECTALQGFTPDLNLREGAAL